MQSAASNGAERVREENRNKLGLEDNAYAKFIITYGRSVISIKEGLQAGRQVTVQSVLI